MLNSSSLTQVQHLGQRHSDTVSEFTCLIKNQVTQQLQIIFMWHFPTPVSPMTSIHEIFKADSDVTLGLHVSSVSHCWSSAPAVHVLHFLFVLAKEMMFLYLWADVMSECEAFLNAYLHLFMISVMLFCWSPSFLCFSTCVQAATGLPGAKGDKVSHCKWH